jgi:glutathione synthase/RimK-type ligase-like ATP-grasp enzyme
MSPVIGIFSLRNDLHALAIQRALRSRRGISCHVFETDDFVHAGRLTWSLDRPPSLRDREGRSVDPRELNLIWWRRAGFPQREHPALGDERDRAFVDNEWKYALHGMLATEFTGVWVNDPERNRRAENKLVQLRAAEACGLRVPRTLVSQDPLAVRRFVAECGREGAIVKAVRGGRRRFLWTMRVQEDALDDAGIELAPAIYQELVPGTQHLRICCFGDDVHCVSLESQELDWRGDLCVPFQVASLDHVTRARVIAVRERLGLRMAIMDAKVTDDGEVVWLEANPQGQFLFAQGMTGVDLIEPFVSFLLGEVVVADSRLRDASWSGLPRAGSADAELTVVVPSPTPERFAVVDRARVVRDR